MTATAGCWSDPARQEFLQPRRRNPESRPFRAGKAAGGSARLCEWTPEMTFAFRPSLLALCLCVATGAGAALAQTAPATAGGGGGVQGGPKVNRSVFHDATILSVTAVTQVFGRSQNLTGAIVEFAAPVAATSADATTFAVEGRTILSARVTADPDLNAPTADGRYAIITLDPADPASVLFAPGVDEAAEVLVTLARPATFVDGSPAAPGAAPVINTRVQNLIVDDFRQFRFTDPATGLMLDYNLFVPMGYDPAQSYPLVLFMHDGGVTGSNPLRTLKQGLGAVAFASPDDQARHPAFVLAPQFPVPLANDAGQTSVYVDMVPRLIAELEATYAIDDKRVYTTGQSGGCMTSIALGLANPDLFAATLCVAGQWNAAEVAPLAGQPFWAIVSEDDAKAWPGMQAIMETLAANGATVTRGRLDAKAPADQTAAAVAAIRAEAGNGQTFLTAYVAGSVLPEGAEPNPGAGHVNTWVHAYAIPALRDWLFEQSR